jgi:hypothetical protein
MVDDVRKTILPGNRDGSLLALALLALAAGALAGLVGAIFRLTLAEADGVRNAFIAWAGRLSASHLFSQAARRRPPLPLDWSAAIRRKRMGAAFLTSRRSCEANFHRRRFS